MIKLLIIADDFTGALDTGVQFATRGADVRVVLDMDSFPDCEVLVADAETRHLSPEQAGQIVEKIVTGARKQGVTYIYKKTDSALRGNVGAELAAVLRASGEKTIPFLPSFPQINRVTREGVHYIAGVPVDKSVFGLDPFEPVRFPRVDEVVASQGCAPVSSWPVLTQDSPLPEADGVLIFDAETVEDLAVAGKRLSEAGLLTVSAGCAGFASVLPELLGIGGGGSLRMPTLEPELLVVCGSVNPITMAQMNRAEEDGFARMRLTPQQKLDHSYWDRPEGQQTIARIRSFVEGSTRRIIETNDLGGNQPTADYAAEHGMDIEDIRQGVSWTVGYLVSQIFDCRNLGTMLVTGGDTLLQCMNYMGVHRLQPICEMDHGIVLSSFEYQGRTQYVITKSGGFGDPELMVRIARQIGK